MVSFRSLSAPDRRPVVFSYHIALFGAFLGWQWLILSTSLDFCFLVEAPMSITLPMVSMRWEVGHKKSHCRI